MLNYTMRLPDKIVEKIKNAEYSDFFFIDLPFYEILDN